MGEQMPLDQVTSQVSSLLVSVQNWGDASFIRLPLVYPGGSFVTVRLSYVRDAIRVSDAGFSYREADSFGAGRSFSKTANRIAERYGVSVGRRSLFVDVPLQELERAILDVSSASHEVAERIVERALNNDEVSISDALHMKLEHLFHEAVAFDEKFVGASSTEWEVSAVARFRGRAAIFHAVANYPISVFKASTAFHDIAATDNAPELISVVSSKEAMGRNHAILAQVSRVIEIAQPDEVFLRAMAG